MTPTPPVRIWATIGRAVTLYRDRLAVFLALAVVGGGLQFVLGGWGAWQQRATGVAPTLSPLIAFPLGLIAVALGAWAALATLIAADRALQGQPASAGESLRLARGKLWRYLGVSILFGLIVVGGSLLLIIPGVYLGVIFSLYAVVIALEPRGEVGALRRSNTLIKGAFWRTFGLPLAAVLLLLPAAALIGLGTDGQVVTRWWAYEAGQVLALALGPLYLIIQTIWYHALNGRQATVTPSTT